MIEDLASLEPCLRISVKESFYEVSEFITVLDISWPHDRSFLFNAQMFKKLPDIEIMIAVDEWMGSYKHLIGHYTDCPPINLPCIGELIYAYFWS